MATAAAVLFAPHHRSDRNFFAAFVLACWIGVGFGFVIAGILNKAGDVENNQGG